MTDTKMQTILIILKISLVVLMGLTISFLVSNDEEVQTLIRIDTATQYQEITNGKEPYIIFDSLRDTPFNDDIKVLIVKIHYTNFVNMFTFGRDDATRIELVNTWLGNMGIRSYPELVNGK